MITDQPTNRRTYIVLYRAAVAAKNPKNSKHYFNSCRYPYNNEDSQIIEYSKEMEVKHFYGFLCLGGVKKEKV